jgi:hypothetical protein
MNTSKLIGKELEQFLSEPPEGGVEEDKIWTTVIIRNRPDDEIPEGAEFLIVVMDELLLGGDSFTDYERRTAQSFSEVEAIVTEIRDKCLSDHPSFHSFVLSGNPNDPRFLKLVAKLGLVKMDEAKQSPEGQTTEVGEGGAV